MKTWCLPPCADRLRVLRALALLSVLGCGAAWAAPPAAGAEAEGFAATYRRGEVLFNSGQYDRAIEAFQAAYALRPRPLVLFNLAQAHRYAGRPREALLLYERFLRQDPKTELRPEVEGYLTTLRAEIEAQEEKKPAEPEAPPPRAEPPAAPPPVVAPRPAALSLVAPAPPRPPRLRVAKWVVLPLSILATAAGATLLAIDGMQVCDRAPGQRHCPQALDTRTAGIVTLAGGGAALGTAGLLFGLDARRGREGQMAMVSLSGRF